MPRTLEELSREDIVDSRELVERVDELEADEEEDYFTDEDAAELEALRDVLDEIGSEARYGTPLIADSYFTEYARELAEEIGAVPETNEWPLYCIDWDWAARELRMDYGSVTLNGSEYWARY